jgi:hypothetical protein
MISVKWVDAMGGVFSGNRGSRGGRAATATLPEARLSHQQLYRVGSFISPRIRPEADGWATVTYGAMTWPVMLQTTQLNLGGVRRWLTCPACSTRRQVLYVWGKDLACRACLGLRFESQHESRRDRLFRRLEKVRAMLGWPPGALAPFGAKPHGMHWRTYSRLRSDAEQLTNVLLVSLNEWVRKAEETLDARG